MYQQMVPLSIAKWICENYLFAEGKIKSSSIACTFLKKALNKIVLKRVLRHVIGNWLKEKVGCRNENTASYLHEMPAGIPDDESVSPVFSLQWTFGGDASRTQRDETETPGMYARTLSVFFPLFVHSSGNQPRGGEYAPDSMLGCYLWDWNGKPLL